jgi:hypothetical protein
MWATGTTGFDLRRVLGRSTVVAHRPFYSPQPPLHAIDEDGSSACGLTKLVRVRAVPLPWQSSVECCPTCLRATGGSTAPAAAMAASSRAGGGNG